MKTFKISSVLILFTFILLTSCSPEDDGIYFEELAESKIEYSQIEIEILDLVNDYRIENGLTSLERLNIISTVAESHTNYMAETDQVSHDNFYERHQLLVNNAEAKVVGENVGFGYSSAKGVVNAWINSDSHRLILETENYTHFGISTAQNSEGRNYFAQIFIER